MKKGKLTAEQQKAASVLSDEVGEIHNRAEQAQQIIFDLQMDFFNKTAIADTGMYQTVSPEERAGCLHDIVARYGACSTYCNILADIISDLNTLIDEIYC